MIRFLILTSALASAAIATFQFASADALPPPETLRQYSIELSAPLSQALIRSVQFTSSTQLQLPKESVWGPCVANVRTWSTPGFMGQSITCQDRTSCFYKSQPRCVMTVVSGRDQSPADLIKILSADPVKLPE